MILGMSLAAFTQLHVIISLIAIVSGIVAVLAMLGARLMPATTTLFLITTVATSVTGFMFDTPADAPRVIGSLDPAKVIGLISLIALALALLALYIYKLAGAWRGTYVVCALGALYLNCFVLVVQSFQKVSFFHALAPTQKEPPFAVAQAVLLILFIGVGIAAFKKFRPIARAPALT
ncbi:MAG TPA: hypothetical protein VHW95_15150 [Steroidobacteraceae bacterium]|jgi:uncharacterized membrane protein|nr:hypothetical protein [Steroidobacteraceae bacterium]